MTQRVTFYVRLFRPRGWISGAIAAVTLAYGGLAFWRDEASETWQPPLFLADVADWLPWWTWAITVGLAALLIVLESAYKLSEVEGKATAKTIGALQDRVGALEEAMRPKLTAECRVERGLPLGARLSLAYLVLTNQGEQGIENAHAQLRVIEHWQYTSNGEPVLCRNVMYKHQDVFLEWAASKGRMHSFQGEAKLRVALGVKGTGNVIFQGVDGGLSPEGRLSNVYELGVTVAADNCPALEMKLYLRMDESSYRNDSGEIVLIDGPYPVEFRPWEESDSIDDEIDIDATRE